MIHDFTPRRIGELLDDAIGLVRANWKTVGLVSAVVVLPIAAAYSVVASFYLRSFLELIGQDVTAATNGAGPVDPSPVILVVALALQALGLAYAVARGMFDATMYANSASLLEHVRVPLKDALRQGWRSVVMLIVVQFIVSAATGAAVGVIAFVLVLMAFVMFAASPEAGAIGIVVGYVVALLAAGGVFVLLSLAAPVVVIEGGIGQAIARSARLVRRHFWRVALIVVAAALLVGQFESAVAVPTIVREIVTGANSPQALLGQLPWGWKVFDGLVQGIAISIVLPFSSMVTLLTYLDLRARDEGMDLLVRAQRLTPA